MTLSVLETSLPMQRSHDTLGLDIMGSCLEKESMPSEARQKKFFCLKIAFLSINLSKNLKK